MQVRQGFEIPISCYQGKVEIHAGKDKKRLRSPVRIRITKQTEIEK